MCHRPNPLQVAWDAALPERQRRHAAAVKELGRDPKIPVAKKFPRDRSDPEGGIPGRYGPNDVCGSMRADPRARARAARAKHEKEKSKARQERIDEEIRIAVAVEGLSPRAKKVWANIKRGKFYKIHDSKLPKASIEELKAARLIVVQGRIQVLVAAYVPIGTTPFAFEQRPENLP